MIPLPDNYRKYGYTFELLERVEDVAIFKQISEGEVIAYEVFEVLKNEETTATFAGAEIHYPAKEAIPSTENWGKNAFTCSTPERAEIKRDYLLERIAERKAQQETVENPILAT